jgi:hypothetical protein
LEQTLRGQLAGSNSGEDGEVFAMAYVSIAVFNRTAFSNHATFNRNSLKLLSRNPDNPPSTR